MGQTATQIESHIESKRADLTSNLRELENRVRSATDWREQFQNRTGTFLGLAFGGGLLLAAMIGGSSNKRCNCD